MSDSEALQNEQHVASITEDTAGSGDTQPPMTSAVLFRHSFKEHSIDVVTLNGEHISLELPDVDCRVHITTDHDGPAEARYKVLSASCHTVDISFPRDTTLGELSLETDRGNIWAWSSDDDGPKFKRLDIRRGRTDQNANLQSLRAKAAAHLPGLAPESESMDMVLAGNPWLEPDFDSEFCKAVDEALEDSIKRQMSSSQRVQNQESKRWAKTRHIDVQDISLFWRNIHGIEVHLKSSGRILAEMELPQRGGIIMSPEQVGLVLSGSSGRALEPFFLQIYSDSGDIALATISSDSPPFRGIFMPGSAGGQMVTSYRGQISRELDPDGSPGVYMVGGGSGAIVALSHTGRIDAWLPGAALTTMPSKEALKHYSQLDTLLNPILPSPSRGRRRKAGGVRAHVRVQPRSRGLSEGDEAC